MSNDYKDFLHEENKVPAPLDDKVLHYVHTDLNPEHKTIFVKLALIQGFIGLITMTFCPQFDFSLTNNYHLFHFFHRNFGHQICMILCGSIFLGTGAIFAASILGDGEVKKIKESSFLYYMSLSILATSIFMLLGAKVYLHLLIFWLMGSIGGGVLLFELTQSTKKFLRA
jgi:hypothetical protein